MNFSLFTWFETEGEGKPGDGWRWGTFERSKEKEWWLLTNPTRAYGVRRLKAGPNKGKFRIQVIGVARTATWSQHAYQRVIGYVAAPEAAPTFLAMKGLI